MTEAIQILTPVGRIVQGDPFTARETDMQGNPLTIKSGPNAGRPRKEWFVALAIPKADPGWPPILAAIHQAARAGFPNLFDAQGNCSNPNFSFKYIDGDSQVAGATGRKPCDNEGFPGHWILKFKSGFEPQCFSKGGESVLTDPASIKRGYYARIAGSVTGNNSPVRPGVYVNLSMIELCGFGEEIKTGPDGAAVFGGTPAGALPPGASPTPIAAPTVPAGAQPTPAAGVPLAPVVPQSAPPAPGDFQATPPLPPFADGPKLYTLPDGQQYTEQQLVAVGWKPEQIAGLPS
jgi:hypothetical protein